MQDHKRDSLDKQVEKFQKLQEQEEGERKQKREQAEIEKQIKVELRVEQEKEKMAAKKDAAVKKAAEQEKANGESSGNTLRQDSQNPREPKRRPNGVMLRGEATSGDVGRTGIGIVRRNRHSDNRMIPRKRKLTSAEKEERMLNKLMGIEPTEEKMQPEEEKPSREVEMNKEEKLMDYIMRRK